MNSDATSLQKSEKLLESLIGPISDLFLPSANEVCEGYVFTGVCLSTVGGVQAQGVCPGPGLGGCPDAGPGGVYPSMH